MGGRAFVEPGPDGEALTVPRMPPVDYATMRDKTQTQLSSLYAVVFVPHPAPQKADYGDIDFIAASPRGQVSYQAIAAALGAKRTKYDGTCYSFAVPYLDQADTYVQVDVHICQPSLKEWTSFQQSYGDLAQILGSVHRPLGFTLNDRGLHLRIEEMESSSRKSSLVFLTKDPERLMHFFGLDSVAYNAGFASEESIFDWIMRGCFFDANPLLNVRAEKSNDRRRLQKRAGFRRFMEDFAPYHCSVGLDQTDGSSETSLWTRQQVLERALNEFGKHEEYWHKLGQHRDNEREAAFWKRVQGALPLEGPRLNLVLRALKRWVDFKDGCPVVRAKPEVNLNRCPVWLAEGSRATDSGANDGKQEDAEARLMAWVLAHWETVRALEKTRIVSSKSERGKQRALDNPESPD